MDETNNLNKKEREDLRTKERYQEIQKRQRNKMIKRASLWSGAFLFLAVAVFGLIKLAGTQPGSNFAGVISSSDWIRGNKEAGLTLVEYSDFQCPACASYYPLVKNLESDYGEKLRTVYRHFPLRQTHSNANLAGQAAEAAGKQNKFWEMHDLIFEKQKEWADAREAQTIFENFARELSLDIEKFRNDLNSDEVKNKVETDFQSGLDSGVNATPTFFLNGKKIDNPRSYEQFKSIIDQALI